MNLINDNIQKLDEIYTLIESLDSEIYTKELDLLSNASIGQHLRHILEFYICLKKGIDVGQICYDSRERNQNIENDKVYAKDTVNQMRAFLLSLTNDISLQLKANYSDDETQSNIINSSLYRELAYAMDHTIHHLAIIKIGLKNQNLVTLDEDFGVAPSTIRYRKNVYS